MEILQASPPELHEALLPGRWFAGARSSAQRWNGLQLANDASGEPKRHGPARWARSPAAAVRRRASPTLQKSAIQDIADFCGNLLPAR